ncbi:MAG: hypothetical protein ORN85_05905 [Sediminibacterium sp.]|nr:hypothetical protein [Sediminibacterium sp.]
MDYYKVENGIINKINSLEGKISEFENPNFKRIGNLKWTIIVASGVLTIVLTKLTFVLGK